MMNNHIGLYVKFHKEKDKDIIKVLSSKANKQGFIKMLIRNYLQHTGG